MTRHEKGNPVFLRLFPWICGAAAYLLYEWSNVSGLFWGDAGEFIAAANTLGIGHPYGHPLFWLAGRLAILFNPSDPAAAMVRLTAVVSAATIGLIAAWISKMTRYALRPVESAVVMFVVSGIMALSKTFWAQATFVEVYNFQAFFIVATLLLFHRYAETKESRTLFGAAYCFGLAVTLGLYVGLLVLIPFILFLLDKESRPAIRTILISLLFFACGLSVWIYLPVRSGMESLFFWQRIESFRSFIAYILREGFAKLDVAGSGAWSTSLRETLSTWMSNIGIWGSILIIAGIVSTFSKNGKKEDRIYTLSGLVLITAFGLLIPLTLTLRQMVDMDVYYISVFLALIPALAWGTVQLMRLFRSGLSVILVLPLLVTGFIRWQSMDISDCRLVDAFSRILSAHLPEHAVLFPVSDEVAHPLLYRIYALGNPEHFEIPRGSRVPVETIESLWKQSAQSVCIEIDDPFLERFAVPDSVCIGGPFLMPPRDSLAARELESAFTDGFSPGALDMDHLSRLDKLSLARLWSRRGVYWFHMYRKEEPSKTEKSDFLQRAVSDFNSAWAFDDFSLEGALHGSNLALALTRTEALEEARSIALKSLRLSPDAPDAYRALYTIAVREKSYEEALSRLYKLASLRPKEGEVRIHIAAILVLLNRIEAARTEYDRGIALGGKPRDPLDAILRSAPPEE